MKYGFHSAKRQRGIFISVCRPKIINCLPTTDVAVSKPAEGKHIRIVFRMNKKSIRRLFIGVMIFLPLQYAAVGIVGLLDAEPWPAFVFPGFKSVPVFDDSFETEQKVFELVPEDSKDDILQQTPAELFPDIPVSQLSGFMRHNFSADRDFDSLSAEGKSWLLDRAERATETDLRQISLITVLEYRRFKNGSINLDSSSVVRVQQIAGESL